MPVSTRGAGDKNPLDKGKYPFVSTIDKGYEADTSGKRRSGPGMSGQSGQSGQSGPRRQNKPGRDGNFVERLDQDGDSRVSELEFHGPPFHFTHFDKNQDGYITREEAPKGPLPGRGVQ